MGKTFSTGLLTNGIWQDASNNIGIGGSPSGSYKLEVTGTAKVSSTLLVSGALTGGGNITTSLSQATSTDLSVSNTSASNGAMAQISAINGGASQIDMVAFGSGSTGTLYGITKANLKVIRDNSLTAQSNGLAIGTDAAVPLYMFTNSVERMRITSAGNVLVNTTTTLANNKMYVALAATESFRAGFWETQCYSLNNGWIAENAYYDNVGFRYRATGYANAIYSDGANGLEIRVTQSGTADQLITWKNAATFAPNGNVTNYSNTTTWQQASDIKIKENVNTLSNSLTTLLNLRPVTFDYKEEFSNSVNWEENSRLNNVGFIAQEFEEVFPKYVSSSERRINGEFETLKNIDTSHLVAYLVKAIQELNQQNQDLKSRLDKAGL